MTVRKRFACLLICFVLLAAMALPVYAEPEESGVTVLSISTAEEFLTFAENCRLDTYSENLLVSLEADIDLSGRAFACVPVFGGTFAGNGHTVSGVDLSADGSMQGLFRWLKGTALVKDLTVSGQVHPGGSAREAGGIAGRNEGKILNCSFTGSLSGGDYVGAIAGSNGVTGIIENCRADGEVHGNHFVGGIVGGNSGTVRGCSNLAKVNTTPQQNTVDLSEISLESLTNTEAINTVTDIGGIAGISTGVIRSCENRGDIGYQHMGYNIGGIAGTQSGYITDSVNHGQIRGRKEVGGIVGQMEPVSLIEYTEDTLQILQGQLDAMMGLVNRASGNAQANAAGISGQIGSLQNHAGNAKDAISSLIPDREDPELPDMDTILAAQNTLGSSMRSMTASVRGIASAVQGTVNGLTRDLNAITGHVSAMSQTLDDVSGNLGIAITDVSDQDTPELLSGKAEACTNFGSVLADLNAGGIAGAMAPENDLDILEDWDTYGEESMNLHGQLRAVVLDCENHGTVAAKRQNVGGIAGWQMLGLVKNALNTGSVDAAEAEYAGGVSGLSTGYIRNAYAKCHISGKTNVGGIAGSATVVTDSLSQVSIENAREKQGAILGTEQTTDREAEDPIKGNYYLQIGDDMGAIDGISYSGMAEPMEQADFLKLEQLPAAFKTVTVRFLFEDGKSKELVLAPGDDLPMEKIPAVPEKAGCSGTWEGLKEAELTDILFDMTFKTCYRSHHAVIESSETREDGRPLLLLEGSFTDTAAVSLEKTDAVVVWYEEENLPVTRNVTLLETWNITASEQGSAARFLLPVDADPDRIVLLTGDGKGNWKTAPHEVSGSYLVFPMDADTCQLALIQTEPDHTLWWIAGIGGVLVIALVLILTIRHGKKKKASQNA